MENVHFNPVINTDSFSVLSLISHADLMQIIVLIFMVSAASGIYFIRLHTSCLIYNYFLEEIGDEFVVSIVSFFVSVKFYPQNFENMDLIWGSLYSFFKIFTVVGLNIDDNLGSAILLLQHGEISSVNELYQISSNQEMCNYLFDLYFHIEPEYRHEFFDNLFSFIEWWMDDSTKEKDKQFVSKFIEILFRDFFSEADIVEIFDNLQKQNPKIRLR